MPKKNKIPKKIAGVKIPKILRKDSLIKSLLNSPTGRQIIANALVAAAGAAASALLAGSQGASKASANGHEDAGKIAKRALQSAAGALTDALSSAAKSAMGADEEPPHKQQRLARTH
jgi:hypothetical protein